MVIKIGRLPTEENMMAGALVVTYIGPGYYIEQSKRAGRYLLNELRKWAFYFTMKPAEHPLRGMVRLFGIEIGYWYQKNDWRE